jgi:protein-tyrosine phosphatase
VSGDLDPPLAVDWIGSDALRDGRPGRLGLTILPGKRGASLRYPGLVYRRDLGSDVATLVAAGAASLLLLVEDAELGRWGDPEIVERATEHGLTILRHPIPDGAAPQSVEEMDGMLAWLDSARQEGDAVVACMGGVGRTGTVAACALVTAGWAPDDAISHVRRVRHPTAVETDEQVAFVRSYARHRSRTG